MPQHAASVSHSHVNHRLILCGAGQEPSSDPPTGVDNSPDTDIDMDVDTGSDSSSHLGHPNPLFASQGEHDILGTGDGSDSHPTFASRSIMTPRGAQNPLFGSTILDSRSSELQGMQVGFRVQVGAKD